MTELLDSIDLNQQDKENIARIVDLKNKLGDELVILGHYYQRLPISLLSDHLGDSFGLSALAAATPSARHIVFCGVEFMAESAEILRGPQQRVYHPCSGAGCPMADMAHIDEVETAYRLAMETTGKKIVPVAYMNTSSEVKAFCGREGGIICTSSNAKKIFEWAYEQGEIILFIPDEHLGTNTANAMGIPREARTIFNPAFDVEKNRSFLDSETRLILWEGFCHVHTWFSAEDIRKAREAHPDAAIVLHPECPENLIALADHNGSTAFMKRFAEEAPQGSTSIIGTEINLVEFLRHRYGDGKTILPLTRSFCPNMYRINLQNLRDTLENLSHDRYLVHVDDSVKEYARLALNRMLEVA